MFRSPTPIVKLLLIINVFIYIVDHMILNGVLADKFSYYNIFSESHQPYQFLTYMFLHANFSHLFGNMLALFFFGPYLEDVLGSERLLKYYLLCGLGAGLLYAGANYWETLQLQNSFAEFIENPSFNGFTEYINSNYSMFSRADEVIKIREGLKYNIDGASESAENFARELYAMSTNAGRMLGASGAIFGLYTAMYVYFGEQKVILFPIPIPVKIKYFVLFYGIYSIYAAIHKTPGDNIAHLAHLGGLGVGYILLWVIPKSWNKFL